MSPVQSILVGLAAAAIGAHYADLWKIPTRSGTLDTPAVTDETHKYTCLPFLPNLLAENPPAVDHPLIQGASSRLRKHFDERFLKRDIDSLSIAVVASNGSLFEQNYGVMRGNETESPSTTSHSQYRIASVSKLFLVLQGLLMEQRGIISWYVNIYTTLNNIIDE